MAYSEPTDRATGFFVTAAVWNQDLAENLRSLFPDGVEGVSYTPALQASTSNPTTGTLSGRRWRVGATQFVWVRYGSIENPGSGTYLVELPVAAVGIAAAAGAGGGQVIGSWQLRNNSNLGTNLSGAAFLASSTTVRFSRPTGQSLTDAQVDGTAGAGTGSQLSFSVSYPLA